MAAAPSTAADGVGGAASTNSPTTGTSTTAGDGGGSTTGDGGTTATIVNGPDPDNPESCPETQPTQDEACMVIATCDYIADIVTHSCQCIANAWNCNETLLPGVCPAARPADDSPCAAGGETLSCEYAEETCTCQNFNQVWSCRASGGFQGGFGTTG